MSAKYIYYQAAQTPKFDDIVRTQNANKNLRNGINNSKTTPKPKLSNVTAEYDKPFMEVRKNLIQKLNEYELANSNKRNDPEVNANIENMKRQILDFGKFTVQEAQAYEFLSGVLENPNDDEGNLLYDVNSLKKVPKALTVEDITSARSNSDDIMYLFGGNNPLTDTKTGDYISDEEGYILSEDGQRMIAYDIFGKPVDTDEYEFERRRNFSNYANPTLFDFGKSEIEYNGVPASKMPEFNFNKDEITKVSDLVDYVNEIGKMIQVDDVVMFDYDTRQMTTEGINIAKNKIRQKIQKQVVDGVEGFKDNKVEKALEVLAYQFAVESEGIDDPTQNYIKNLVNNTSYQGADGTIFEDFAIDEIFKNKYEGQGVRKAKNYNEIRPGSGNDYYLSVGPETLNNKTTDGVSLTREDEEGFAQAFETIIYKQPTMRKPKRKERLYLDKDILFKQAVSNPEALYNIHPFTFVSDQVNIYPVNTQTGQLASKAEIESGKVPIKYVPFVEGVAKSEITEDDFTKNLKKLKTQEEKEDYNRFSDLIDGKPSSEVSVLVPLDKIFVDSELNQFKNLIDLADKLTEENASITSGETAEERRQRLMNTYGIN